MVAAGNGVQAHRGWNQLPPERSAGQGETVKRMALAWILTLPAELALSGLLFALGSLFVAWTE